MVEALTIVLAVGVTRGWRSALVGAAAALVALAALVGPSAGAHPCADRRPAVVVGALLLGLRPAVAAEGDPARNRPESQP